MDSVSAAAALVRQKREEGDMREWHILVASGDYKISDTISLTAADSGTSGAPLVIEALNINDPPRFCGGTDIPFSELLPASESVRERIGDTQGKVMQLNLKARGITDYGELSHRAYPYTETSNSAQMIASVDGCDLSLASTDWYTISDSDVIVSANRTASGIKSTPSFRYTDDRISSWLEPELAWVSGSLGYNYSYDFYPVDNVDTDNKIVTLREGAIVTKNEYPSKYTDHVFKFSNVLEELDSPGEYYIDRANGMLYIYPPESAGDNSVLTLSQLDKNMIEITGAHDISIKNLELCSGRRTAVTTVGGGERISLEGMKIHGFGKEGVALALNTGSSVKNCEIYDIGENGVNIRGGGYSSLISSQNLVEGNHIYRTAQIERGYKTGIMVGYQSVGVTVRHNYVHDTPHAAIIFYGSNNLFEYNCIERAVLEFNDMDAMYANHYDAPWERGNVIRRNVFSNIGNQRLISGRKQLNIAAIRTDNQGSGLDVYQNLFYNIGSGRMNNVTCVRAQGTYNKVHENLFVDCSGTYNSNMNYDSTKMYNMSDSATAARKAKMDDFLANSVYADAFPELLRYWDEHPWAVKTNEFKNNVVVNIAAPLSDYNGAPDTEGFLGASQLVDASGNVVTTQDPGFINYMDGNFALSEASAAYKTTGFDFNISCRAKK